MMAFLHSFDEFHQINVLIMICFLFSGKLHGISKNEKKVNDNLLIKSPNIFTDEWLLSWIDNFECLKGNGFSGFLEVDFLDYYILIYFNIM